MARRPGALELIAGLADDPVFGPVILLGEGGTDVERIRDRAVGLPPLNSALARDLVARHPGLAYEVAARRLAGYLARRGYSSGVVARAVASTVERADSDIEFNPEPD